VQLRKAAHICTPFEAYSRERAWKVIGDTLQGSCYLNRDENDGKIRAREQRRDIGKYSFPCRTIKRRNKLPADTLATFPCISHIFRKRAKKVIIREVK